MIESDAHTDNPEAGLRRVLAFDNLIREISTIVNTEETLLVFTADHSFDLRLRSGKHGDSLLRGYDEWKANAVGKPKEPLRIANLSVDGHHTGEEVLVSAMGPGAEQVRGFMPNTRIFHIMLNAYGWTENRLRTAAE
jgi:alkaline phosphatase